MDEPTALDDWDPQDGGPLSVWFTPAAEGVEAHVSLELPGPKRYLRVWLAQRPVSADWGGVLHDTARLLWRQPGATHERLDRHRESTAAQPGLTSSGSS